MIKFVTALFECGWCLTTAMGREPKNDDEIHGDSTLPPEGWRFVYNYELEWTKSRQKGTCKLALCMGLMDVMCEKCCVTVGNARGDLEKLARMDAPPPRRDLPRGLRKDYYSVLEITNEVTNG